MFRQTESLNEENWAKVVFRQTESLNEGNGAKVVFRQTQSLNRGNGGERSSLDKVKHSMRETGVRGRL